MTVDEAEETLDRKTLLADVKSFELVRRAVEVLERHEVQHRLLPMAQKNLKELGGHAHFSRDDIALANGKSLLGAWNVGTGYQYQLGKLVFGVNRQQIIELGRRIAREGNIAFSSWHWSIQGYTNELDAIRRLN